MFKSLEIGRRIKSEEFEERALALREQLMRAQLDLARRDYPLIIVVAGSCEQIADADRLLMLRLERHCGLQGLSGS